MLVHVRDFLKNKYEIAIVLHLFIITLSMISCLVDLKVVMIPILEKIFEILTVATNETSTLSLDSD